tara:strand:+ start:76 stop:615 length:540 start_codon:yes stop_codon:yes gene_type:complete
MEWILILTVLIIGFGPILWLRPSKKDRRLSAIRTAARGQDFIVQKGSLLKLNPDPTERVSAGGQSRFPIVECMVYSRVSKTNIKMDKQRFRRPKDLDQYSGHSDLWVLDSDSAFSNQEFKVLPLISGVLAQFPEDILALEFEDVFIRLYWLEGKDATPETVIKLSGLLDQVEEKIRVLR